jgi:hypothetical protein
MNVVNNNGHSVKAWPVRPTWPLLHDTTKELDTKTTPHRVCEGEGSFKLILGLRVATPSLIGWYKDSGYVV